jgi:hypothetical protein
MPVAGLHARPMSFDQVRLQSASPFAAHLHGSTGHTVLDTCDHNHAHCPSPSSTNPVDNLATTCRIQTPPVHTFLSGSRLPEDFSSCQVGLTKCHRAFTPLETGPRVNAHLTGAWSPRRNTGRKAKEHVHTRSLLDKNGLPETKSSDCCSSRQYACPSKSEKYRRWAPEA